MYSYARQSIWMPEEQRLVWVTDAERGHSFFCSLLNGSLDVTTRNHWRAR